MTWAIQRAVSSSGLLSLRQIQPSPAREILTSLANLLMLVCERKRHKLNGLLCVDA